MSPSPKIMCIPEEPREILPSHAMSRESSISYYSTPPELDISSSSPLLPNFLDFDGGSNAAMTASPSEMKQSSSGFDLSGSDHDLDQMFIDSLDGGDAMMSLDKSPPFLLENFEDPFTAGNPWQEDFDDSSDPFFDSLG